MPATTGSTSETVYAKAVWKGVNRGWAFAGEEVEKENEEEDAKDDGEDRGIRQFKFRLKEEDERVDGVAGVEKIKGRSRDDELDSDSDLRSTKRRRTSI